MYKTCFMVKGEHSVHTHTHSTNGHIHTLTFLKLCKPHAYTQQCAQTQSGYFNTKISRQTFSEKEKQNKTLCRIVLLSFLIFGLVRYDCIALLFLLVMGQLPWFVTVSPNDVPTPVIAGSPAGGATGVWHWEKANGWESTRRQLQSSISGYKVIHNAFMSSLVWSPDVHS